MKALRIYSIIYSALLFIGETIVVLTSDKFWPLSLDDYVAIALLLYALRSLNAMKGKLLQFGVWAYMCGKLYTMFFIRIDPAAGEAERILPLFILLLASIAGLILSLRSFREELAQP
ncbi:hypothetical protein [Kordiimonas laminariae]|uniref:hypothetical protein n=1 Tax=Kordiimonas laminariae TaxID=2917717 RepID=UPI001FF4DD31|nr:hypothetical protein [Kordiimonas laminariae]MCK0068100.1 hypothetical protein [Kordiimonas laminariae]